MNGIIKAGSDLKYNLCGQFAVSYLTGKPVETMLSDWITKEPSAKDILTKDSATGVGDLKKMLDVYGCTYSPDKTYSFLDETFRDKLSPGQPVIVTPGKIKEQLDLGNSLILGVGVNQQTGLLNDGNTAHWVVVEKVEPQGVDNGQVLLYNPLPNKQEVYSYAQVEEAWKNFNTANTPKDMTPSDIPMSVFVNLSSCHK